MKRHSFFAFCLCFLLLFPTLPRALTARAEGLTQWNGTVEHFFTHSLIAHPEIAFAPGNSYAYDLDRDCLTPDEFSAILQQAYDNGYMLVDLSLTYRVTDGRAERVTFPFPKGKKPLVLSFDDVVYASKNRGRGMADKLVLSDGRILSYTEHADPQLSAEREFVPILETFIAKHPDFSFRGARGIICLTGFDGILGYRTQRDSPDRQAETERVKPVVQALKQSGWKFACHSYAHGHMKKYTADKMRDDIRKWKTEVAPLVGDTQWYVYPYGEWVLGENCSDERHRVLEEEGFHVFFGVGSEAFYGEMPLKSKTRVLFIDRSPMDGISLRARETSYSRIFRCSQVYDPRRPVPYSQ